MTSSPDLPKYKFVENVQSKVGKENVEDFYIGIKALTMFETHFNEFVSRFDRLIGEHISTNLKKDKEFLLEFSKYNHTAPYFMDDSLRTNKKFLLDLIKVNYKTLLLLNLDYILGLKDENN